MLRRLKSDKSIISDLPDKVEQDQFCALSRHQAALYESVVREGLKGIAGESDTFQRQGLVLQMILALKQVCNHPAHYLKQGAADPGDSVASNATRHANACVAPPRPCWRSGGGAAGDYGLIEIRYWRRVAQRPPTPCATHNVSKNACVSRNGLGDCRRIAEKRQS